MKPSRRRVLGAILVVAAGLGGLIFAGGQVGACLGPLGVTPIQCAKALGYVPTVGLGLPFFAAAAALGVLVIVTIPAGQRRGALIAAVVAAGIASVVFSATWVRTWTGVDSAGRMLSVDRPLDFAVAAALAIVAALVAALAWAFVAEPVRTRLAARS
jgi:hypothetical protein